MEHLKKLKAPGKGFKKIVKQEIKSKEPKDKELFNPDVCENWLFWDESEK